MQAREQLTEECLKKMDEFLRAPPKPVKKLPVLAE